VAKEVVLRPAAGYEDAASLSRLHCSSRARKRSRSVVVRVNTSEDGTGVVGVDTVPVCGERAGFIVKVRSEGTVSQWRAESGEEATGS
jgi:hypothetical protein